MAREQQVRDAVDRFLARLRQETDLRLQELAADLLQIVQGDMRTSRVDVERAAVEVARAVAKGGTQARHDLITRIVSAVRRLDESTTLRGVLDALAEGASAGASRVAVLIVDGDNLRSYRHYGFAAGQGPVDIAANASPMLAATIAMRQTTTIPAQGSRPDPLVPAFMRVQGGQLGLLIPLMLGKQVVALVYVEGPDRQATEPGEPVWTEQVEVLVRHAAARLENVTSQRTVEVLTNPS
jgi:hypothetical protein